MGSRFAHQRAFADSAVYWACSGAFGALFLWSLQDARGSGNLSSAVLATAFGVATIGSCVNLIVAGVRLFHAATSDLMDGARPGSGGSVPLARLLRLSLLSLACVALFWSVIFANEGNWLGATVLGAAIGSIGMLIRTWSAAYRSQVDGLLVHGPYRFLRHPKYLGTILAYGGAALLRPSWLTLAATMLVVVAHCIAAREEEQDLERRYGPPAEAYRRTVPGLIPRLQWIRSGDEDRLDWTRLAADPNSIAHLVIGWVLWLTFLALAIGLRQS